MATPENLLPQESWPSNEEDSFDKASVEPIYIDAHSPTNPEEYGLSDYIEINDEIPYQQPQPLETRPMLVAPEVEATAQNQYPDVTKLDDYRKAHKKRLEAALITRAQQGDKDALEKIWLDAQSTANRVAKSSKNHWPLDDKIQTCLEVVPGAVRSFDSNRGASFSTFVYIRMRGALADAERAFIRSNGLARGDWEKLQDALKRKDPQTAIHELTQPTVSTSGKKIGGFLMAPYLLRDTHISSTPDSLEFLKFGLTDDGEPIGGSEPVADQDVFEEAARNIDAEKLRAIIEELPERERIVITNHYGLFGSPTMTVRDLGNLLGLSETRIWQIQSKAMKRIETQWQNDK
jgi:RNA polymerase sigma factor for flagellar operon FliA